MIKQALLAASIVATPVVITVDALNTQVERLHDEVMELKQEIKELKNE